MRNDALFAKNFKIPRPPSALKKIKIPVICCLPEWYWRPLLQAFT